MIDVVVTAAQVLLGLGAVLATTRAIVGPDLVDRIVAIDAVLLMIAAAVAVETARDGRSYLAPVVIVVALVAFAGTVLVARFIEWRDT
jgi:multicomponent Na+:H+ antiporter subunit F